MSVEIAGTHLRHTKPVQERRRAILACVAGTSLQHDFRPVRVLLWGGRNRELARGGGVVDYSGVVQPPACARRARRRPRGGGWLHEGRRGTAVGVVIRVRIRPRIPASPRPRSGLSGFFPLEQFVDVDALHVRDGPVVEIRLFNRGGWRPRVVLCVGVLMCVLLRKLVRSSSCLMVRWIWTSLRRMFKLPRCSNMMKMCVLVRRSTVRWGCVRSCPDRRIQAAAAHRLVRAPTSSADRSWILVPVSVPGRRLCCGRAALS
mmetsp:Transcript_1477/g.3458  ORF Transcript_1477/g.3458 Transcript_1477/m.3458 type:complete len:260 (-) Transcript_1477:302-1081(-)